MKLDKRLGIVPMVALAFTAFVACNADNDDNTGNGGGTPTTGEGSGETDGYKLVWEDAFNGETIDENIWSFQIDGDGSGNRELEYYRKENCTIEVEPETGRRCLTLTARRERYEDCYFTSGRISSKNKKAFRHGKIEAYIRLPKTANGLWPAFWMMGNDYDQVGWPRCCEIDILEAGNSNGIKNGTQEYYFNGACHWGFYKNNAYPMYSHAVTNEYSIQDGFHLFTLIWDEEMIRMYLDLDKYPDAEPYFEMGVSDTDGDWATGNYFHKECFILFNLAVGGNFTGIHDPSGITALPNDGDEAKMYVDFVKVYQK